MIITTPTSTHPATGSPLKNLYQNNSKSASTPLHQHYDDHFDKRNLHLICYPISARAFKNYAPPRTLSSVALTKTLGQPSSNINDTYDLHLANTSLTAIRTRSLPKQGQIKSSPRHIHSSYAGYELTGKRSPNPKPHIYEEPAVSVIPTAKSTTHSYTYWPKYIRHHSRLDL